MSLWFAFAITALRSVLLALLAVPICVWLKSYLRSEARSRSLAWVLLLVPVIAPRMLTGFGYANFSISLVHYPVWNEFLYAGLLLLTLVPVGTVISFFTPPPTVSDEALHCLDMVSERSRESVRSRWRLAVKRCRPSQYASAAGLMFVLAFQEFELASLMGVTSWTVWLFDAQAGGLLLSESLRYAAMPLLCELFVLLAVGAAVWKTAGLVAVTQDSPAQLSKFGCQAAWIYLRLSVFFFCAIPWAFILYAALSGLPQLTNNFRIGADIVAGSLFAFLATAVAYVLAELFVFQTQKRHSKSLRILLSMISGPGLLGSLVLGLSILSVFQSTPLHTLYGTPVPWLVGLVLFLLPRAILVLLILAVVRSPEANHLTKLLMRSGQAMHRVQARELQWRGTWAMHFIAFVLLFFWAYSDLTMAAILGPPGIVSAPVRLYNLMHYGQSAVLSAMVVATFGIPVLVFGAFVLFRRPLQRVLVP